MLHDLAEDADSYCMKIQSFFVDRLAGMVLSDGREFTCYRVFQMRKHSTDEDSLYIGMQELIRKAINAGEFRGDVSAKEINDYLFVVFRGVLYEWCLCPADQVFSLAERMERLIGYALKSFQ